MHSVNLSSLHMCVCCYLKVSILLFYCFSYNTLIFPYLSSKLVDQFDVSYFTGTFSGQRFHGYCGKERDGVGLKSKLSLMKYKVRLKAVPFVSSYCHVFYSNS
jgi:hypothetical protein